MIVLRQADVYAPQFAGRQDILIAGGEIVRMAQHLDCGEAEEIDARGKIAVPGLIDQHIHITGGGGEGSFHTKTPEVQLSSLIEGGITTAVGLLGTDGFSRSVENLVSKAKALKEEGLSVYCLTGSYSYPSVTLTGDVKKDILFIDEVIGVKLALADHRSSNVTLEELIRLASDARVAGMLSGKAGIVTLHMGDDPQGLNKVFDAIKQTAIPAKVFHPTHVTRNPVLFEQALDFLELGGWIDLTAGSRKEKSCGEEIALAKQRGLDTRRITISSDGQGSWSNYDARGNLTQIGVSSVKTLHEQFVRMVKENDFDLAEALSYVTSNPADALQLSRKGRLREGMDADIVLLDNDLAIDTVIARGQLMMKDKQLRVRGTYE